MPHPVFVRFLAVLSLVAACGNGGSDDLGRTGPATGNGTGGAGGGAAGGPAGSAGAPPFAGNGGSAGMAGACAGKVVASTPVFVSAPGAQQLGRPKLVVTSTGRIHVLANAAFAQPEGPTPIVRTSFDAASTWPPAIAPFAETGLFLDPSTATIAADAQGDGVLVAASALQKPAGPPASFVVQSLGPDGPAAGPPLGFVLASPGFQLHDLLTQAEGALVAFAVPAAAHWVEAVVQIGQAGVTPIEQPSAGCSLQPTRGALVQVNGATFLARAASPSSAPDGCDGGPTGMDARVVSLMPAGTLLTGALDMGTAPMTLLAAGRDSDLWLLSEFISDGEDPPPLPAHLTRLDAKGAVLAVQPMLPDGGIVTGSITMAATGQQRVAVTAIRVAPSGIDLQLGVRHYDAALAAIGDVVLAEPQGSDGKHLGGTRTSTVATGGSVFVAWETAVGVTPGVAIARVDCL